VRRKNKCEPVPEPRKRNCLLQCRYSTRLHSKESLRRKLSIPSTKVRAAASRATARDLAATGSGDISSETEPAKVCGGNTVRGVAESAASLWKQPKERLKQWVCRARKFARLESTRAKCQQNFRRSSPISGYITERERACRYLVQTRNAASFRCPISRSWIARTVRRSGRKSRRPGKSTGGHYGRSSKAEDLEISL